MLLISFSVILFSSSFLDKSMLLKNNSDDIFGIINFEISSIKLNCMLDTPFGRY